MRTLIFTLITVVTYSISVAQYDPKAKEILSKVSAKYKSMKSYSVTFEQSLHSPLSGVDETNQGSAIVSTEKFKIRLGTFEIITDGKTVWTHMIEDKEVNITNYDAAEMDLNPSNVYKMWEKGYKYILSDEEVINNVKYFVVELNPEDRTQEMFKVRLWIDQTNHTIKQWSMFEKNGNRYTYKILSFVENAPTDANTFKFDKSKYPNVRVEDLR